jgi:hypothetical protein
MVNAAGLRRRVGRGGILSGLRDTVLAAIDGGARDRAAIVDATGLEAQQVSNLLFGLKGAGLIVKSDDGYSRPDGAPAEPKARKHEAIEREASPPPAAKKSARKKSTPKRKAKPAAVKRAAPAPAKTNGLAGPVEFTYFGEFVVFRRKDITDLLAMLERWRHVVER